MSLHIDAHDVDDETEDIQSDSYMPSVRHTNFHMVFSTNQREGSLHPNEIDDLIKRLKQTATDFGNNYLNDYIVLNEVNKPGLMADKTLIQRVSSCRFEFKTEIGPKRGLIHLHMAFYTSHRALCIQLDTTGVKACLRKLMKMPGAYFYCKVERLASENLEDYIRKTIIHYE